MNSAKVSLTQLHEVLVELNLLEALRGELNFRGGRGGEFLEKGCIKE